MPSVFFYSCVVATFHFLSCVSCFLLPSFVSPHDQLLDAAGTGRANDMRELLDEGVSIECRDKVYMRFKQTDILCHFSAKSLTAYPFFFLTLSRVWTPSRWQILDVMKRTLFA